MTEITREMTVAGEERLAELLEAGTSSEYAVKGIYEAMAAAAPKPSLTLGDWLGHVMEEAAEVAKAASKCRRFGYGSTGPGDYGVNCDVLFTELGELLGAMDQLPMSGRLQSLMNMARATKKGRVEIAHKKFGPGSKGYTDVVA